MNAADELIEDKRARLERLIVAAADAALELVDAALVAGDEASVRRACAAAFSAMQQFPSGGRGAAWLSAAAVERLQIFQITFSLLLDRMDDTPTERPRA